MGCASSTPTKVGPNVAAAPEEPSQAPRRQGSSLQNRPVSQRGDDGYAAFISHVKAEASMEARFLQTELEGLFQKRVFLDSDDLRDLRKLQDHVRECDCFILVQSARRAVYASSWALGFIMPKSAFEPRGWDPMWLANALADATPAMPAPAMAACR